MKSYTKIIQEMYSLNLRKDEQWGYTFCFTEGLYMFDHHSHSTGCSLTVYMVAPDGERLKIYHLDSWYSSFYEFNNDGKKLGFQVDGPWVAKVGELMKGFEAEIETEKARRMELERERAEKVKREELERIERFKKLVEV